MEYTEESIDLKQYWLIFRRHWLPAAAVMGSVSILTLVITLLQTRIYQADGQILLKEDSSVISTTTESPLGSLGSLTSQSNPASTEIEIIKSEPIVQKTIQSLKLKDPEGLPLKSEDFLLNLIVVNVKDTDIITISYKSPDKERAAAVVNKMIEVYKQQNLAKNRGQATAARQYIETQLPKAEQNLLRYEAALRKFKEKSKVVSLPDEIRVAADGIGSLQETLTTAQSQLADAQTRTQSLRNQVGLSPQEGLQVNALSQSPAVQKALTDLQVLQQTLATTRTQLQPDHPLVQDLEDKQAALQAFLNAQVGQVIRSVPSPTSPSSPNLQASVTQQTLTDGLIQAEVQRLGLQSQVNLLLQTQNVFRQRMTDLPRIEQLSRELERQLAVAQVYYETLLKSLQEFQIAENQNIGNVDTVESALVPDEPISPKILLNLAIGVIMGLLLGVGTALVLEALDGTVKTVQEAQEIFDLTVLGTIPNIQGTEKVSLKDSNRPTPQLPIRDNPRSAVSEAYRMLRANLKFLSSDDVTRVITITSSIPQEGKSTVTANLALVLAEMGHRVLVVDADLRRPSQHQIWELPNSVGLSHILVESGKWSGVVRSENAQLDIITAGVTPPNPVRLIDSKRMISLIKEWQSQYDYVLIDTPPLAVAADALLIAQNTDGLLMVARPGVLTSAAAELSKAALLKAASIEDDHESKQATVLGLVLNGVITENEPDSSYYYYANDYYSADAKFDSVSQNGKPPVTMLGEEVENPSATSTPKT